MYLKLNEQSYHNGKKTLWIERDLRADYNEYYHVKIDEATIYRTGNYEVAEKYLANLADKLNKMERMNYGE